MKVHSILLTTMLFSSAVYAQNNRQVNPRKAPGQVPQNQGEMIFNQLLNAFNQSADEVVALFHHEAVTNKPKGGPNCNIHFVLFRKLFEILHLSGFGDFASFQSASVPPPAAQQQQQQASLLMGGGGGGPPPPAFQPQQQVMQQQQQQPSFADFGSFQASGAAATAQASGVAMAQVWLVQNCSWYIYLVDNGSVIIV